MLLSVSSKAEFRHDINIRYEEVHWVGSKVGRRQDILVVFSVIRGVGIIFRYS